MSPLSPRTSSYFDHNSKNTIMDNFQFIIQFYTVFPPSLAPAPSDTETGLRWAERGAGGFGTSGEEWGIMTRFITNGMSMVHETWRLNHRISILNYNCYAGPGCQKVWDIDTSLPPLLHPHYKCSQRWRETNGGDLNSVSDQTSAAVLGNFYQFKI